MKNYLVFVSKARAPFLEQLLTGTGIQFYNSIFAPNTTLTSSLIMFQLYPGFEESGAHSIFLPKALPVAQIALTGSIYSTLAITIGQKPLTYSFQTDR